MSKPTNQNNKYSDLILLDILHLDRKNFFSRYRVDILGFSIFFILMMLIIIGTFFLKNIGS
jgi:hypothetical protein